MTFPNLSHSRNPKRLADNTKHWWIQNIGELISYLGIIEYQLVELDAVFSRLESSAVLDVDLWAQISSSIVRQQYQNTDILQTTTVKHPHNASNQTPSITAVIHYNCCQCNYKPLIPFTELQTHQTLVNCFVAAVGKLRKTFSHSSVNLCGPRHSQIKMTYFPWKLN